MYTVVTHSGNFHSDDVFAVAAFHMLLGDENVTVIRTRDESIIASADYVVDVGGVYDHVTKRYDHHQNGSPVRDNGIPYAGFGLMWKHYGTDICGSSDIADFIEQQICQPVDAGDNGISLYDLSTHKVKPFELYNIVSLFAPPWGSQESKDEQFMQAVEWARAVIERTIIKAKAAEVQDALVEQVYENTPEKKILIFNKPVSMTALIKYPDVHIFVSPDDPDSNENWVATCVRKNFDTFESRVYFPKQWAGLRGEQLAKVSGFHDAGFCHKARFVFVAGSQESAVAAALLAR